MASSEDGWSVSLHGITLKTRLPVCNTSGKLPPEVLDDEFRSIFVSTLTADLEMLESAEYATEPPLSCGISVFGGHSDAMVTCEELCEWKLHTEGPFEVQVLRGDHFYFRSTSLELFGRLQSSLHGRVNGNEHEPHRT